MKRSRDRINVLIVEDNRGDARILMELLKNAEETNFSWTCVDRLSLAANLLNSKSIDAVLLNLSLPDSFGIDTIKRCYNVAPRVPIVVITGLNDKSLAIKSVRFGAQDYLVKGQVDNILLERSLRHSIERHSMYIELQKKTAETEVIHGEIEKSLKRMQSTLDETIRAMAKAIEYKDTYTASHQRNVARLASAIAERMNLQKSQIKSIELASTIHDIGKIGIPSEFLSKSTVLTEHEFNVVKTHAQIGFEIIKEIEFPWPIAQIILQHHERLNGSGYPSGLVENQIILEAKILTVADVVEAIASHRPYRPALGIDKALQEIVQNQGILFDRAVVGACLMLFHHGQFRF